MAIDIKKSFRINIILSVLVVGLIFLNILFLVFVQSEAKIVQLLKTQLDNLLREEQIIASSQTISQTYATEVELISGVFPTEETIPVFIESLEELLRGNSDEYSLRFAAVSPVKEQDKLFLPVAISLKTDLSRLTSLFEKLEKIPYMTHLSSISAKTPQSFNNVSEYYLVLKVYVQEPFTSK